MTRNGFFILVWPAVFFASCSCQGKQAGIFYSTLYTKTMEPLRLDGFGGEATAWFLADVNGDKKDDAVVFYSSGGQKGQWHVALSDGTVFGKPFLCCTVPEWADGWTVLIGDVNGDGCLEMCGYDNKSGRWEVASAQAGAAAPVVFGQAAKAGSDTALLGDVDGDGRADAILIWAAQDKWLVGLSTGEGFQDFAPMPVKFPGGADQYFLADVDSDGKADAIAYYGKNGLWATALSNGKGFSKPTVWRRDFGTRRGQVFVCDADGDGRSDIGYYNNGTAMISYSDGAMFGAYRHRWITGLSNWTNDNGRNKQNPPPIIAMVTGSIDGQVGFACTIDQSGRWFAVSNPQKSKTLRLAQENNWAAWRCSYLPQIPGHEGTYDSGDPVINDRQIRMMHDAGFTYVTLDITNGGNAWVDKRASRFMERVRYWNQNLAAGDHRMHVNVSLGGTRGVEGEKAWFNKLNQECKRAWEEFYLPFSDCYYHLNGKPLVIHMISNGLKDGYYLNLDKWTGGDRRYIDKMSNRWMTGWGGCTSQRANFYGWEVREKFGNPHHPEMMPAMPGFWNGGSYVDREGGDFYRSHWMRVIQHQPESVWVNSFNETWEHTSIEPAFMFNTRRPHAGITMWTDYYGNRMDDFYWVMTCQYMKLYMDNALYEGTCFQEFISDGSYGPVYRVTAGGFTELSQKPQKAPVLLLPRGFRENFQGKVVQNTAAGPGR